jgi:superfamily II DNA or RNA helicase
MKSILSHKGYSINKKLFGDEQLNSVRKELTVVPETHPDYPTPKQFAVYEEGANWLRVPRTYGLKKFGIPSKISFQDNVLDDDKCVFQGQLRPTQILPHDTMLASLLDEKGFQSGLLCLATGSGKTVTLLSLVSKLKRRTCVLVHKSQLLQQWKAEIHRFLPNMKVGIVQQTKKDFDADCDIFLIMIQTLLNIPSVPTIFGATVIDECHHIPSATFSKVLFKVNARYVIGLTATPNRKDGLTQVLHWHVGDIVYHEKPDRRDQNTTFVEVYRHVPNVRRFDPKQYSQMITDLCKEEKRNALILKAIDEHFEQDTSRLRSMLILTERVSHARTLYGALFQKYDVVGDENRRTCGLLIGGMKKHTIEDEMKKMILVATYNLMSEGISIEQLNSIVFASPKKDVVQALGRIFRKVHKDINPLIIDISDSVFRGQERARLSIYKRELNGNIRVTVHEENDEEYGDGDGDGDGDRDGDGDGDGDRDDDGNIQKNSKGRDEDDDANRLPEMYQKLLHISTRSATSASTAAASAAPVAERSKRTVFSKKDAMM